MGDLHGKRVVVTRPRQQAGEFAARLRRRGAIPLCYPVIEIAPLADTAELDEALLQLESYDWFVLTSVNGVEAVWDRFASLNIEPELGSARVAAIGPRTAEALEKHGVQPDFVPTEYTAEAILPGLGNLTGRRVLLTRADIARPALARAIHDQGGAAVDIPAYRTLPAQPEEGLDQIRSGVDILTFTSSSTVHNFVRLTQAAGLDTRALPENPLVACIGPITAATAEGYGLSVDIVAETYTTDGLLAALDDFDFSTKAESP
ncbi:MAG: uroporphyrinogen-III synthase [Anaerolineales bacterium]